LFSYVKQGCVWPELWEDSCDSDTTTSPIISSTTPTLPFPVCGTIPPCYAEDLLILHPAKSPEWFYRCEPTEVEGFVAVLRHCLDSTLFSYKRQGCVWPEFWEDSCNIDVTKPIITMAASKTADKLGH
jgi:hypothetical protein